MPVKRMKDHDCAIAVERHLDIEAIQMPKAAAPVNAIGIPPFLVGWRALGQVEMTWPNGSNAVSNLLSGISQICDVLLGSALIY